MRRRLPSLVTFALVATAAVALAQVSSTPPARATAFAATGSFEISNSDDGQPIFAASGIAPGGSSTGTVSIEDTGSEPVALTLRREALIDTPDLDGGLLSARLDLSVVDITEPAAPHLLYAGRLDSMPDQPAGELGPGESRTFEFTATLPAGGTSASQNAVQGRRPRSPTPGSPRKRTARKAAAKCRRNPCPAAAKAEPSVRLRARLHFVAVGTAGADDSVGKTVRLRVRRR